MLLCVFSKGKKGKTNKKNYWFKVIEKLNNWPQWTNEYEKLLSMFPNSIGA